MSERIRIWIKEYICKLHIHLFEKTKDGTYCKFCDKGYNQ